MSAEFARGICPECQRVVSGRIFGLGLTPKIELLRHKNLTRTNWCNGGRKVVQAMVPVPGTGDSESGD
jgi:hypothetical protein